MDKFFLLITISLLTTSAFSTENELPPVNDQNPQDEFSDLSERVFLTEIDATFVGVKTKSDYKNIFERVKTEREPDNLVQRYLELWNYVHDNYPEEFDPPKPWVPNNLSNTATSPDLNESISSELDFPYEIYSDEDSYYNSSPSSDFIDSEQNLKFCSPSGFGGNPAPDFICSTPIFELNRLNLDVDFNIQELQDVPTKKETSDGSDQDDL